jgi:hypothetical protein
MQQALGPKDRKAFRDNYLAALLICLAITFSFRADAQYDSTKVRQTISAYGFDWKNGKFGSLVIPKDTPKLAIADSGGISFIGGKVWTWTGFFWKQISGSSISSAPTLQTVTDSGNSTSLALRLVTLPGGSVEVGSFHKNGSVDEGQLDLENGVGGVTEYHRHYLVKDGDTIFFPAGPGTLARLSDISGSGSNMANADLTANGDHITDYAQYVYNLVNGSHFNFRANAASTTDSNARLILDASPGGNPIYNMSATNDDGSHIAQVYGDPLTGSFLFAGDGTNSASITAGTDGKVYLKPQGTSGHAALEPLKLVDPTTGEVGYVPDSAVNLRMITASGIDPYYASVSGANTTISFWKWKDSVGGLRIVDHFDSTKTGYVDLSGKKDKSDSVAATGYASHGRLTKVADSLALVLNASIATKVTNAGGAPSILEDIFANRPAAGTAGRIFIATDTKVQYRDNGSSWDLIGSAGGSQTFPQVLAAGRTQANADSVLMAGYHFYWKGGQLIIDSAHFNPDLYVADSITFFGTSISFGVGASDPRFKWTTLLANRLNAAEANYSVSGSSGQVDFLNLGWKIHMADRFHRWFIIEYGVNDIINGSNIATWDTAHYGPILRARVDSLISFYGYLAGQIVLLSPSYINPATNANATLARQAEYFACIQSVATTRGCKFVDTYHPMVAQGGALGLWDGSIHPGDAFHSLMTDRTAFVLKDSVKEQAQPLAVNGLAEFQKVKIRANDTATYKDRALLSDSAGNLKRAPQNLYAMNSVFFTQPQPINLNIGGTANFGFTPLSLPPAIPEIMNVNGTLRSGAIRVTQGMVAGTTGSSLSFAFTGGNGYIYTPNGETVLINSIGGGQVGIGAAPIDNITKLSVTGSVISSGSALWKGGMSFNTNSGVGTYTGYNSGIGYLGAYDFTNSLTKLLAINYQGGNVLVNKNTDNGLANFQVNGAAHFSDSVILGKVHTGDGTMAILVYNQTSKSIDTVAQSSIGAGGFTPANPTGGVALAAINGTATTYLRSDVTLALSQAIAPTWTALHTFNPTVTASAGASVGHLVTGTHTAAANSDNLAAVKITPTFVNGSFTTVNNFGLWVSAGATYLQGGLMVAGSTPNGGLKNTMILNTGTNGYFETYNSSGTAIPCLINTIGGGAITLGAAVTATSNITASGYVAGKGGITTNNSAVSLGFSGGNGYLASYGSAAVAPLFMNYQGGNVTVNTNTDNSTAAFQILKTTNQLALHYDNTHYSQFLVNSAGVLSLTPTGITTKFAASTTAGASINIPSGTSPTSPNHGDTWTDANHLNIRLNGVTYQLDQQSGSGVTTVGTFSGSSQTNGASISTNTIIFGPADATNPGMMTTGTQTIAGNKTFTGNLIAQHSIGSGSAPTSGGLGTNVTSVTVTGTDKFLHLSVVTSGNIAGTIATITFNAGWPNTPIPVISPSNTTTAQAVVNTTGGYFIAAGVSTTTMNLIGAITGAGTYDFNIFVGGN